MVMVISEMSTAEPALGAGRWLSSSATSSDVSGSAGGFMTSSTKERERTSESESSCKESARVCERAASRDEHETLDEHEHARLC